MLNNVKISFEHSGLTIRDPIDFGIFSANSTSEEYEITIRHNSTKPIRGCSFYVSPFSGIYNGSYSATKDYDLISWFADNYGEYGLSIRQSYEVYGEVFKQESKRLIDVSRLEEVNFFTGFEIEILSGSITGEKRIITDYDVKNSLFYINEDFSIPVEGERYKITMNTLDYISGKKGTSSDYSIPLLYNGGKIDRFESAKIYLRISTPPFIKRAGVNQLDFNMKFTPEI